MVLGDLASKACPGCEGNIAPLHPDELAFLLESELPQWAEVEGWLERTWVLQDFAAAIGFVNEIAEVAEAEGHHPDLHITGYKQLTVRMQTHSLNALTENDTILAAKIDRLWRAHE